MKKEIYSYYTDENGNRWDCKKYSEEEAEAASKTLVRCSGCMNCDNCTDCKNCTNCTECVRCGSCRNCERCVHCMKCNGSMDEEDGFDE